MSAAGALALVLAAVGFLLGGPAAPLWLLAGLGLLSGGAYARYVSRQTVRVADRT